jgi:hypothetical protein
MLSRCGLVSAFVFLFGAIAFASEVPQQVVLWPNSNAPTIRFSFSKFKDLGGSVGREHPYATETTAENLSSNLIQSKRFSLYIFDKKQVRIAEAWIEVSNLGPGKIVKFQTTFMASGTPVLVQIEDAQREERKIVLTVNSVPQGASLKVDGVDQGTTPKLVEIGPGKHRLSFSKDGFRSGVFPLEMGAHDVSGGSVSYELGAAQFDTLELRDGTVLNGDLDSVSGMDVTVRIGGELQKFNRNKIKRILLVEREAPEPSNLPAPTTNQ